MPFVAACHALHVLLHKNVSWNCCSGTGTGVPLAFQDLSSQDFRGQKLYKADLRGTNFSKANMEGVSLFGAFCKDAKFVGARMNNADLESVDFENADLSEAILEGAQVSMCLLTCSLLISSLYSTLLQSSPKVVIACPQVTNAKFKNIKIAGSDCKLPPVPQFGVHFAFNDACVMTSTTLDD